MALTDLYSNVAILIRWAHVMAGITWIGLLYYFNFVNVPLQASLSDEAKKAVNPQMMPRTLWWFRWGAMITFLAGVALFILTYFYTPGQGFGANQTLLADGGGLTARASWILMGMLAGTIMWFNVWFIIWPAQKKLLGGTAGDQAGALKKRAGLASRANTYLSGPMLFGMLGAPHYGASNHVTIGIAVLIGFAVIWVAIKVSPNVGKSV